MPYGGQLVGCRRTHGELIPMRPTQLVLALPLLDQNLVCLSAAGADNVDAALVPADARALERVVLVLPGGRGDELNQVALVVV